MGKNEELENWRAFYRKTSELRIDFATRGWETIKAYLLISGIIVAAFSSIGALVPEIAKNQVIPFRPFYYSSLFAFPMIIIIMSYFFRANFYRECKRMYEQIAVLQLIEEKLGMYEERTTNVLFKEEKYYVPEAWTKNKINTVDAFIKRQIEEKERFWGIYKNLFVVFPILFTLLSFIVFILLSFS
jgi:hypothetical protein